MIALARRPLRLLDLIDVYRLNRPCIEAGTLDQYDRACRSLCKFCDKSILVRELNKTLFLQWIARRMSQVCPRTVKRERGDLLTLWRFAFAEGYHRENPDLLRIPTIRTPKKAPVSWRLSELERWLAACERLPGKMRGTAVPKADWWRSFVLFLYDTAARPSAALQVAAADIDLQHGCVVLRADVAKTDRDDIRRISQQTIRAIASHFDPSRSRAFPWPYHKRLIWRHYKHINRLAGLPEDRYHSLGCLRRTAASYATAHGSVELAQRLLGHTSPATTVRHYIDPRITQQQAAIDILPRPKF